MSRETFKLDGIPVHLLPFEPRPEDKRPGRWLYRARNLPGFNFYASVGAERRAIEKQLSSIKPNVMLCHFGFMALRLLPIAQQLNIALVAHFHGLDLSSSLRNRWYRWSLLRALDSFSAIVVVASYQKRWMIEHGVPAERVHLIPCGVPTQLFKPAQQHHSKTIRFIAVSRLVEKKGVEYSIRAFAQVVMDCPNVRLTIVGDGPLRGCLEELVRNLGLEKHVSFVGMVEPEKVRSYFLESEVFIQHSIVSSRGDTEGSPVSIAEASASGLPVVATRCGGIEDQVVDGQTGFLVPQRDIGAMAERMLKLARNPGLRNRFGQAGRKHMVEQFDASCQIKKLEAVLLNCAVT